MINFDRISSKSSHDVNISCLDWNSDFYRLTWYYLGFSEFNYWKSINPVNIVFMNAFIKSFMVYLNFMYLYIYKLNKSNWHVWFDQAGFDFIQITGLYSSISKKPYLFRTQIKPNQMQANGQVGYNIMTPNLEQIF